jgi:hypothetical protein
MGLEPEEAGEKLLIFLLDKIKRNSEAEKKKALNNS